jgi:hypothetical protein
MRWGLAFAPALPDLIDPKLLGPFNDPFPADAPVPIPDVFIAVFLHVLVWI